QSDGSATVAVDDDGVGGVMQLTVDTTDNVEAYLYTTNESFKFANNKPLMAVCRFKINAASSINACAMHWGLMNAVAGADNILDATGEPADAKDGIIMAKNVDAATIAVYAHTTGTGDGFLDDNKKTTDQSMVDDTYVTEMFTVEPISATEKRVKFFYDPNGGQNWQQMKDSSGNLITMTITQTDASETELSLYFGIKNASTDAQVLDIDYVGVWQLR
ncbi:unnamed protein product, partial [marine sediment metagenome]